MQATVYVCENIGLFLCIFLWYYIYIHINFLNVCTVWVYVHFLKRELWQQVSVSSPKQLWAAQVLSFFVEAALVQFALGRCMWYILGWSQAAMRNRFIQAFATSVPLIRTVLDRNWSESLICWPLMWDVRLRMDGDGSPPAKDSQVHSGVVTLEARLYSVGTHLWVEIPSNEVDHKDHNRHSVHLIFLILSYPVISLSWGTQSPREYCIV